MAEMISTEDIVNVKRDLNDIGECINGNETGVVTPRYGPPYKTIPLVSAEFNEKTIAAQNKINEWNAAIALITQQGGVPALAVSDASGKTQQEINNVSVKNGDFGTVLNTTVELAVNTSKPSFKFGLKGLVGSFDDNNNNFRGLAKPNEPWADENTGIGSTMFGRDNAPYAYLSMANGHGCSNFGVASFAGGAGTGTGNPDAPNDAALGLTAVGYGYCSFAYGKDTQALGRVSTAFGQTNVAGTVHSFASGYESKTGKGLATHPVLDGVAVDDDGDCAFSHGYRAFAYGNYSVAFGNFVRAYHGSKVIGSGINPGSLLEGLVPKSIVLGSGVDVPTIILTEGDVVANGAFGKLGLNTKYKPRERVEIVLKENDKIALRTETSTTGKGAVDLQGTASNGDSLSIFRIEYTSPNGGSAFGVTTLYQNGNQFLRVNESGDLTVNSLLKLDNYLSIGGVKVLGGQQSAIADSTGTAADNQRAINAILAALRGHGLIAP